MKKWTPLAIIFIIIAIVAYAVIKRNPNQAKFPKVDIEENNSGAAPAQGITKEQVKDYSTYLQQYQEGRRIQFDEECKAIPGELTFANQGEMMLDNRSSKDRQIKVNNDSYEIAGYGYKIITLSAPTLPASILVGCDERTDSGTITLTK